jgi:transposase-like protein
VMRREYDPELKAQVMAALLAGQSVSTVSKQYNIPAGTVGRWNAESKDVVGSLRREKKGAIGDLLLEYLTINLKTLTAQSETFADREWLLAHSPSEAAVLHGVLVDKTVRLLEALSGSPFETGSEAA